MSLLSLLSYSSSDKEEEKEEEEKEEEDDNHTIQSALVALGQSLHQNNDNNNVHIIINKTMGSNVGYEYNTSTFTLTCSHIFPTFEFSFNYGVTLNTRLNVCLLENVPLMSGCRVPCRLLGHLEFFINGKLDYLFIGIPIVLPIKSSNYHDIFDVLPTLRNRVKDCHYAYLIECGNQHQHIKYKPYRTLEDSIALIARIHQQNNA